MQTRKSRIIHPGSETCTSSCGTFLNTPSCHYEFASTRGIRPAIACWNYSLSAGIPSMITRASHSRSRSAGQWPVSIRPLPSRPSPTTSPSSATATPSTGTQEPSTASPTTASTHDKSPPNSLAGNPSSTWSLFAKYCNESLQHSGKSIKFPHAYPRSSNRSPPLLTTHHQPAVGAGPSAPASSARIRSTKARLK